MKSRLFLSNVLPVFIWMAIIFSLSTRVGSAAHTDSALNAFLARWFPHWFRRLTGWELDELHYCLRKVAHVTEYGILGILVARALRGGRPVIPPRLYPLAWLLATLYAATDEFHQIFVPGRTPKVTDVLLDSAGVAFGLGLYLFVCRRRRSFSRALPVPPQETP